MGGGGGGAMRAGGDGFILDVGVGSELSWE